MKQLRFFVEELFDEATAVVRQSSCMLFGATTVDIRTNNCSSLAKQLQLFDESFDETTAVPR